MKTIPKTVFLCAFSLTLLIACSKKTAGSAVDDTGNASHSVTDAIVTINHEDHQGNPFYACSLLHQNEWENLADPELSRILTQSDMEKLSLDMPIDQVFDLIGPPARAYLTNGHFDYMYWNTEYGAFLRLSWNVLDHPEGNDIYAISGGAIQYEDRLEFFIGGNEIFYFDPADDPNYTEAPKNTEVPQT